MTDFLDEIEASVPALRRYARALTTNEKNFAGHIWDYPDADGRIGAEATVVVNSFIGYYEATGDWQAMAWWVHDHLDYSGMEFFPKLAAFNLQWRQDPARTIYSHIPPARGWLTKPGMPNHAGNHAAAYAAWLAGRPG